MSWEPSLNYNEVITTTMASQITSLTIVYSTVYSGADQNKHQSSASLAFVRGIHRGPVNSPHKWPVTWKMFPFDDVIMGNILRWSTNRLHVQLLDFQMIEASIYDSVPGQQPNNRCWVSTWPTITRTTRTPAFWGYPPPPHDYPHYWPVRFESQVHAIDQFISDSKSKQGESRKMRKICEKLKIFNFVINLTLEAPSL